MKYTELINTLSEVIENEIIHKKGLTLLYELSEIEHKKLDEHLFYKTETSGDFKHREVIVINNGGVKIKIIKTNLEP